MTSTKRSKSKALEPEVVEEVRAFLESGHSGCEARAKFGIPYPTISKIKNRRIYRKTEHLQSVATTLQPDATTLQSVATTLQPDATTLQPDATTLQPDATTLQPDATTLQPNTPDYTEVLQVIATELQSLRDEMTSIASRLTIQESRQIPDISELQETITNVKRENKQLMKTMSPILDRLS